MTQLLQHAVTGPSSTLTRARPDVAPGTQTAPTGRHPRLRWCLALGGQFVLVLAALSLSGPGRIDIVDGQTRYEVARSLVDHGDSIIRDKEVIFAVYEGRDGQKYTNYRFPQSGAGILAILAADATGSVSELRRQFFFTLIGPFAAAILAVTYSVWFRHLGLGPRASLAWATAGIFCTPSWYYGTSTFDDILGTTTVVLAVAVAWMWREKRPLLAAAVAGLLMAWAVNCKQPLAILVLPVLALTYPAPTRRVGEGDTPLPNASGWWRAKQLLPIGLVLSALALGVVAYKIYDAHKFPPGTADPMATYVERYGDIWTWDPLPGLLSMAFSPSSGALWYCPTIILSYYGWRRWRASQRRFCDATLAAAVLFTLFISFLTFFKGEPCWGPRYLTPVFALAWVFAPAGAAVFGRLFVRLVLGLGVVVQLLGLSVDPMRLFLETPLPFNYYQAFAWLGFDPITSHLLKRPAEVADIIRRRDERSECFSPAPLATHGGGMMTPACANITSLVGLMAIPQGLVAPATYLGEIKCSFPARAVYLYQRAFHTHQIYNSFRPWWASQTYLAEAARPVDIAATLALLLGLGAGGWLLLSWSYPRPGVLPSGS
jgi:hypothetical protein